MQKVNRKFYLLLTISIFVFGVSLLPRKISKIVETPFKQIYGCKTDDLSGNIDYSQTFGLHEGERVEIPKIAYDINGTQVPGITNDNRWIEIDLSDQKLFAWEGSTLFIETPVSSGLQGTPTPVGEFRILTKLRAAHMQGGTGRNYYNLPNVSFVMFFAGDGISPSEGFGLRGTYWHNGFGTPRSYGCIDLPTTVAKQLYFWVDPAIQEGKWSVTATDENPGTRIVIHD